MGCITSPLFLNQKLHRNIYNTYFLCIGFKPLEFFLLIERLSFLSNNLRTPLLISFPIWNRIYSMNTRTMSYSIKMIGIFFIDIGKNRKIEDDWFTSLRFQNKLLFSALLLPSDLGGSLFCLWLIGWSFSYTPDSSESVSNSCEPHEMLSSD